MLKKKQYTNATADSTVVFGPKAVHKWKRWDPSKWKGGGNIKSPPYSIMASVHRFQALLLVYMKPHLLYCDQSCDNFPPFPLNTPDFNRRRAVMWPVPVFQSLSDTWHCSLFVRFILIVTWFNSLFFFVCMLFFLLLPLRPSSFITLPPAFRFTTTFLALSLSLLSPFPYTKQLRLDKRLYAVFPGLLQPPLFSN